MGVEYSAYTVIGVTMEKADIFPLRRTSVRGCEHEVANTDSFCSKCGAPRLVPELRDDKSILPGFDSPDEDTWEGPVTGVHWSVHRERSYGGPGDWIYIGIINRVGQDESDQLDVAVEDLVGTKEWLRQDLGELWNADNFGIFNLCESG